MAQPPDQSGPLPLSARPAHLSIRAADFTDRAGRWAREAQEHLRTFWKVRLSLTKKTAPDVPLIVAGEAALALSDYAQSNPRINPRRARSTALKTLALPPQLLVLAAGDLAHIERLFASVAPPWLTSGWSNRVICAEPHTDDVNLRKLMASLGVDSDESQWRVDIFRTTRGLARTAAEFRREIDIQIDPQETGYPEYLHIHILDHPGVELTAWAAFGEYLAGSTGIATSEYDRAVDETEAAVARMVAVLMRTRAFDAPGTRLPQDAYIGRSVIGTPRTIVRSFFAHAMEDEDAVALGAGRVGVALETAYEHLEALEAHLTRPTRAERGQGWA